MRHKIIRWPFGIVSKRLKTLPWQTLCIAKRYFHLDTALLFSYDGELYQSIKQEYVLSDERTSRKELIHHVAFSILIDIGDGGFCNAGYGIKITT